MARLKLGGGKAVVIGNPRTDKTPLLLQALARAIDRLNGRYIAAEDSGTSVADMKLMHQITPHIAGIEDKQSDVGMRSGDPSPASAYRTFVGIRAAVKDKLGRDSLDGLRVAIQGIGNVGFDLTSQLRAAGARLWVADIHPEQLDRARNELAATVVAADATDAQAVEVFAPCALGAVLNDQTIPQLKAQIVAGAANNQLAEARHGVQLMHRGILYAPDYVINAGGIIDIYHERIGFDRTALLHYIDAIYDNLLEILERAPGRTPDRRGRGCDRRRMFPPLSLAARALLVTLTSLLRPASGGWTERQRLPERQLLCGGETNQLLVDGVTVATAARRREINRRRLVCSQRRNEKSRYADQRESSAPVIFRGEERGVKITTATRVRTTRHRRLPGGRRRPPVTKSRPLPWHGRRRLVRQVKGAVRAVALKSPGPKAAVPSGRLPGARRSSNGRR